MTDFPAVVQPALDLKPLTQQELLGMKRRCEKATSAPSREES